MFSFWFPCGGFGLVPALGRERVLEGEMMPQWPQLPWRSYGLAAWLGAGTMLNANMNEPFLWVRSPPKLRFPFGLLELCCFSYVLPGKQDSSHRGTCVWFPKGKLSVKHGVLVKVRLPRFLLLCCRRRTESSPHPPSVSDLLYSPGQERGVEPSSADSWEVEGWQIPPQCLHPDR